MIGKLRKYLEKYQLTEIEIEEVRKIPRIKFFMDWSVGSGERTNNYRVKCKYVTDEEYEFYASVSSILSIWVIKYRFFEERGKWYHNFYLERYFEKAKNSS